MSRPRNLEYLNVNMADVDEFGPAVALAISYIRYRKEKVENWQPSRRYLMADIGLTQRQADKSVHIWYAINGRKEVKNGSWMPDKLVKKLTNIGVEVNRQSGSEVNHQVVKNLTGSGSELNQKWLRTAPPLNKNKEISINKESCEQNEAGPDIDFARENYRLCARDWKVAGPIIKELRKLAVAACTAGTCSRVWCVDEDLKVHIINHTDEMRGHWKVIGFEGYMGDPS